MWLRTKQVRRLLPHETCLSEALPYLLCDILIIEFFFGTNLLPFPEVGSPVLHISYRGVRQGNVVGIRASERLLAIPSDVNPRRLQSDEGYSLL